MLPILLRYGYIAALFFVTSIFSLTVFGMHLFSTYFLLAEQSILNGLQTSALAKFDATAKSLGYLKYEFPKLQPKTINEIIEREAKRRKVSPNLIQAIIYCESSGDFEALSSVGAKGIMQVMSENASKCGIPEFKLHDPEANIGCGTQIISANIDATGNNVIAGLEMYLGGPKCVGNRCRENADYIACVTNKMAGRDRPRKSRKS